MNYNFYKLLILSIIIGSPIIFLKNDLLKTFSITEEIICVSIGILIIVSIIYFLYEKKNVINLIDGYRSRGHLFTRTNPVRDRRSYSPSLDIEYFDLSNDEIIACNDLIKEIKNEIIEKDSSVKGFNIGSNAGKISGQSILHCHIHLIPRRAGDVENPQGGVRSVIPSKQHYKRKV